MSKERFKTPFSSQDTITLYCTKSEYSVILHFVFGRRKFLKLLAGIMGLPLLQNSLYSAASSKHKIMIGAEVLQDLDFKPIKGKRVGLLTHPAAMTSNRLTTTRMLYKAKGVELKALFGAEHGFDGRASAGEEVKDSIDLETGLPVYSLYGPGPIRKPTRAMLKDLDMLIYDIQDTGCRSYTFVSSLGLALEACAESGVEFVVLDRPNPLGGVRIEGPRLNPKYKSFVSQWNIPYVHGMTSGEMARMINGEGWTSQRGIVTVVKMRYWKRQYTWADIDREWIPTSPNIPKSTSPLHYVSTGLAGEIGGLNIGIRTTRPFETIAAPWIDSEKLTRQLNSYKLTGVKFHPISYTLNKKHYYGSRVEFTKPDEAPLMPINFYALDAIKKVHQRDLYFEALKQGKKWDMFDKLCGGPEIRQKLAQNATAYNIISSWKEDQNNFRIERNPYLLYN